MNTAFRKLLPGSNLHYIDARAAIDAIKPGAYNKLPYTARVHAENIVRKADPQRINDYLKQLIERKRELDFPWFPARVVCHDILGQTALVDLAGLRDAIADQGGDPAKVNPVVPVQLIVDHSLAVECGGFDPNAFEKNRAIEDRRNEDRFHFIDWTKLAFKNVDVIPPGNGIMHQINLERMSPVIGVQDGVAYPDTCVGTDSHTPHVDALGVIAVGVGGLEAENVMLGRASWMRLPDMLSSPVNRNRVLPRPMSYLHSQSFCANKKSLARIWSSTVKARLHSRSVIARQFPTWRPSTAQRLRCSSSISKRSITCGSRVATMRR
jgi:2-methylcitrate dehydratase (2-methyl-trans-aconitate forming)